MSLSISGFICMIKNFKSVTSHALTPSPCHTSDPFPPLERDILYVRPLGELTLSVKAYNILICYKLSDNGVSKLCFVVTVRPTTEINIWWCGGCRHKLP